MKYIHRIALFLLVLVISMPLVLASNSNLNEKSNIQNNRKYATSRTFKQYESKLPSGLPKEDNALVGDQCIKKHEQTSKIIDSLGGETTDTIVMVIRMIKGVCKILSIIDIAFSAVNALWGGQTSTTCCLGGEYPYIASLCKTINGFYVSWKSFYLPVGGGLCCIINCNWCKGQNCISGFTKNSEDYRAGSGKEGGMTGNGNSNTDIQSNLLGIEWKGFGSWDEFKKFYSSGWEANPLVTRFRGGDTGSNILGDVYAGTVGAFGFDPYENIYVSGFCLCVPGVLFNVKKLETIYKAYDCCIEQACENGISTEPCEKMLAESTCMYWEGSALSMLLKIIMGLITNSIAGAISYLIKTVAISWLPCIVPLFSLANVPSMLSSLTDDFDTHTLGDMECSDLGFGELKKSQMNAESALNRAKSQKGRKFVAKDTNKDGVLDTMDLMSNSVGKKTNKTIKKILAGILYTDHNNNLKYYSKDTGVKSPKLEDLVDKFIFIENDKKYKKFDLRGSKVIKVGKTNYIEKKNTKYSFAVNSQGNIVVTMITNNHHSTLTFKANSKKEGNLSGKAQDVAKDLINEIKSLDGSNSWLKYSQDDTYLDNIDSDNSPFTINKENKIIFNNKDVKRFEQKGFKNIDDGNIKKSFGYDDNTQIYYREKNNEIEVLSHSTSGSLIMDIYSKPGKEESTTYKNINLKSSYELDGDDVLITRYSSCSNCDDRSLIENFNSIKNDEIVTDKTIKPSIIFDVDNTNNVNSMTIIKEDGENVKLDILFTDNDEVEIKSGDKEIINEAYQDLISRKQGELSHKSKLSTTKEDNQVSDTNSRKYEVSLVQANDAASERISYILAWTAVSKVLGEWGQQWINDYCKEEYEASKPINPKPQRVKSRGPSGDPNVELCRGEKVTIATAKLLDVSKYDNLVKYKYTYLISACDSNITYNLTLSCSSRKCKPKLLTYGVLKLGNSISKDRVSNYNELYDEICIDTSSTERLCVPYLTEVKSMNRSLFENISKMDNNSLKVCDDFFDVNIIKQNSGYKWAYSLKQCNSDSYAIVFVNDGKYNSESIVDNGFGTKSYSGFFNSSEEYDAICYISHNHKNCKDFNNQKSEVAVNKISSLNDTQNSSFSSKDITYTSKITKIKEGDYFRYDIKYSINTPTVLKLNSYLKSSKYELLIESTEINGTYVFKTERTGDDYNEICFSFKDLDENKIKEECKSFS